MKIFYNFLLAGMFVLPLMLTAGPAAAINTGEAEAIVQEADQAVREATVQLQATVYMSNQEISDLSMQLVDLAVTNYAVASDFLAALEAGETVNQDELANCRVIAQQIKDAVAQLASGEFKTALATFAALQALAAGQPAPANPGTIPNGLEDIADQLTTTMAAAGARRYANATTPPNTLEDPRRQEKPPAKPPVNPPASKR